MKRILKSIALLVCVVASASSGFGQIPDLLDAFDAGGRSLGMGGVLHGTDPSSMSAYYNPASLGYITKGEIDLALHNLPNSSTSIGNTRSNPTYSSRSYSGNKAVTDLGVALPVKPLFGNGNASIALNYNVGGYVHDVARGPAGGLNDGNVSLQNYRLNRSVETDFISLAYGQSNRSKTFSFGVGALFAQAGANYLENASAVDSGGNMVGFSGSNIAYQAHGAGLIIGGEFIPAGNPNFSFGLSYRTPIGLNAGEYSGIYDRIPGRVLADASYRLDGMKMGSDFVILGTQYEYFFDGDSSVALDRSNQSVYGFGVEYNHLVGNFRIPLRIGYESASSGGIGFEDRRIFTYGIGIRPSDSRYSLDLNYSTMEGGGKDFGISAGYRFGK